MSDESTGKITGSDGQSPIIKDGVLYEGGGGGGATAAASGATGLAWIAAAVPDEHDTELVVRGNELVCVVCGTTVLALPPELMRHTYVDPNQA